MATKVINKKKVIKKKVAARQVELGRISIHASFNNTIVTASTYPGGEVLSFTSSGQVGFKGTKKGTPYASTTATKVLLEKLQPHGLKAVHVFVSGAGSGRDAALRAIAASGLKIVKIHDVTPLPHNGVRPKKARRV